MIEIYENSMFVNYGVESYLYAILARCINPATNRVEINGKPMNTLDLIAFVNFTPQEFKRAITKLIKFNAVIIIYGKNKEYYYVNPYYMRDPRQDIEKFDWLLSIFEGDSNQNIKELVYIKKGHRDISFDISKIINDFGED